MVWFITGCSTGFGRTLAEQVLAKGYTAVITARNTKSIEDLAAAYKDRALVLELDVTKPEQIAETVRLAEAQFGRIDVLVNNAGIGYFAGIEESEETEVRRMFEINFFGLSNVTLAVLPGMRARRKGHILNISSIGGLTTFPGVGYYCASKFAVEGLSVGLAKETANLGIRVTLIEPGPFRTDWAGRSASESPIHIADYSDTVGATRKALRDGSNREAGDPVKGAAAIIRAVEEPDTPLHLLLGKVAYDVAIERVDSMRQDFEAWKDVTLGADFSA
ncbi:MAG: oxidoreductase [Edaphobacter sp.]|uniref:oxidoreductase n=1 Tax=Edaphobacter sp. TaxID=1934404 RepID=UPI00238E18FF|nr:oxidoreductase [Edaphobacter sp.]MDE1177546.1 oxidoreductase [Edaphobacter sp.]